MPREFTRADRVADAIQRLLATLIPQEVRDPRVGMVNINDVTVTRDMAYAKVYVTFVGTDDSDEAKEGVQACNQAAGSVSSLSAKGLTMRGGPRLQFIYDNSSIRGQQLSSLIDQAVDKDRARRAEVGDDQDDEDQ